MGTIMASSRPDNAPTTPTPPAPGRQPYVDVSRRPKTFYVFFILLEFWLGVAGIALVIVGPWVAGAALLAVALAIFVAALVLA
jgi:hypothetical protein